MSTLLKKNFADPDSVAQPAPSMSVKTVTLGGAEFRQVQARPGWRWLVDLQPTVKTDSCQFDHLLYMISGKLHSRMADGQELEYGPGDIAAIPPGHDGWTVGDEPAIWLEIPH